MILADRLPFAVAAILFHDLAAVIFGDEALARTAAALPTAAAKLAALVINAFRSREHNAWRRRAVSAGALKEDLIVLAAATSADAGRPLRTGEIAFSASVRAREKRWAHTTHRAADFPARAGAFFCFSTTDTSGVDAFIRGAFANDSTGSTVFNVIGRALTSVGAATCFGRRTMSHHTVDAAVTDLALPATEDRSWHADGQTVDALFSLEAGLTTATTVLWVVFQILAAVRSTAGFVCVTGIASRTVAAVARDAHTITDHRTRAAGAIAIDTLLSRGAGIAALTAVVVI